MKVKEMSYLSEGAREYYVASLLAILQVFCLYKKLYLTVIYSDTIDRIILTPYNTTSKLTEPLGETDPIRKYDHTLLKNEPKMFVCC